MSFSRSKIICTIGPTTNNLSSLKKLHKAGMNVVRINMSHANHEDLKEIIGYVKSLNKSLNQSIGIMDPRSGNKNNKNL